jgi:hypothetical protein
MTSWLEPSNPMALLLSLALATFAVRLAAWYSRSVGIVTFGLLAAMYVAMTAFMILRK